MTEIPMRCEGENEKCPETIGSDYKRKGKDLENGWETEPIFLCQRCAAKKSYSLKDLVSAQPPANPNNN